LESRKVKGIGTEELEKVLDSFKGSCMQRPPEYSSVKVKGKRAYKYARRGEKIDIKKREVHISDIKMTERLGDIIGFDAVCSSGTYIRSLAYDIGEKLGSGASLFSLRRRKIGVFSTQNACSMEDISRSDIDYCLIGIEEILCDSETVIIKKEALGQIRNGSKLLYGMIKDISGDIGSIKGLLKIKRGDRLIAVYKSEMDPANKQDIKMDTSLARSFIQF